MLDSKPNQPSKLRTKNWVEINDDSRETYNTNSQIEFKTTMLKPSLCGYSDTYIFARGRISITGTGDNAIGRRKTSRWKK